MSIKKRVALYATILIIGLLTFVLEIFVFQKPDGVLGLLICIVSIFMTFGGAVKLCKISKRFENSFISMLDILFFLP